MSGCRQTNIFDKLIAKQLANVSASDRLGAKQLALPYAIDLISGR